MLKSLINKWKSYKVSLTGLKNKKMQYYTLIYLALFAASLYAASNAVIYFIAAFVIAYILNPSVSFLQKLRIPKSTSVIIMLFVFICSFLLVICVASPLIYNQSILILKKISYYKANTELNVFDKALLLLNGMPDDIVVKIKESVASSLDGLVGVAVQIVSNVFRSGYVAINIAAASVLIPVISFYIMKDWDSLISKTSDLIPVKYKKGAKKLAVELDYTMSGYLRGQLYACFAMILYYSIALSVLKLDSSIALGFLSGLLIVIPYLGAGFSAIICALIAGMQYGDFYHSIIVVCIFIFGNIIESNFVSPKIIGERVGLHPAWLLFGILTGGGLFGFFGVLLAVPLTAAFGTVIKFGVVQYKHSKFYKEV